VGYLKLKIMKKSFVSTIGLWLYMTAVAQPVLTIGDQWKPVSLGPLASVAVTQLTPAMYADKLLIVDFWATWCGTCVASMPKVAALQQRFGDSVQFVYVTVQDRKVVDAFLDKRPSLRSLGLPIVTGDTMLIRQFPCVSVPHVVWIGADKHVKAITGGEYLTEATIAAMLQRKVVQLPLKEDVLVFDYEQPWSLDSTIQSQLIQKGLLLKEERSLKSRSGFNAVQPGMKRYYSTNNWLVSLYADAYSLRTGLSAHELYSRLNGEEELKERILETRLPEDERGTYSYEGMIRAGMDELSDRAELLQLLQGDLDKYLGIRTWVKVDSVLCWVIRPVHARLEPTKEMKGIVYGLAEKQLNNQSGKAVANAVYMSSDKKTPVLYDGAAGDVHRLTLPLHYTDLEEAARHLEAQGYSMRQEWRLLQTIAVDKR
jgi:thiol-disulfide isomerase/thioredoxin